MMSDDKSKGLLLTLEANKENKRFLRQESVYSVVKSVKVWPFAGAPIFVHRKWDYFLRETRARFFSSGFIHKSTPFGPLFNMQNIFEFEELFECAISSVGDQICCCGYHGFKTWGV